MSTQHHASYRGAHAEFAFLGTRDLILYRERKAPGTIVIFYGCARDKNIILRKSITRRFK